MIHTNEEKVEIILFYGQSNRNLKLGARLFDKPFSRKSVSTNYEKSVVFKFLIIFSIKSSPRSGRSSVKFEDLQINILGTFTAELK